MLNVHICEDDETQLGIHKRYAKEIISLENFDMEVACTTKDPYQLLECVGKSKNTGLYLLDIVLKSDMNGINLAEKIRRLEPDCYIVFISNYDEVSPLLFKNQFNADYISKEETTKIKKRMLDCMIKIDKQYRQSIPDKEKIYTFKVEGREISIHYKDIIFIRTARKAHKIILQTKERRYELNGQLKDIIETLDSRFYMCHESYVINKDYIKENGVDFENNVVYLISGDICPISVRKRKGLEHYRRNKKKKGVS